MSFYQLTGKDSAMTGVSWKNSAIDGKIGKNFPLRQSTSLHGFALASNPAQASGNSIASALFAAWHGVLPEQAAALRRPLVRQGRGFQERLWGGTVHMVENNHLVENNHIFQKHSIMSKRSGFGEAHTLWRLRTAGATLA